jgi:hypothetical protein
LPDEHPLRDVGTPREVVAERLGHALQSLASELAERHRQVALLEKENAQLRAELGALRGKDD